MNLFQETTPIAHAAFTFDGEVSITFEPTVSTVDKIILQFNDIQITKYSLLRGSAALVTDAPFAAEQYDAVTDKWSIPVTPALNLTEHTLKISYVGQMRDDMEGFYRSYYMEGGQKVWMASTQLQQTEARRAFPCFDVSKKKKFDSHGNIINGLL